MENIYSQGQGLYTTLFSWCWLVGLSAPARYSARLVVNARAVGRSARSRVRRADHLSGTVGCGAIHIAWRHPNVWRTSRRGDPDDGGTPLDGGTPFGELPNTTLDPKPLEGSDPQIPILYGCLERLGCSERPLKLTHGSLTDTSEIGNPRVEALRLLPVLRFLRARAV